MNGQPTLLEKTLALVRNRGRLTLREVAKRAEVDFEWLSKFARGEIADPGVNKVQRVHDSLAGVVTVPPSSSHRHRRAN